MRKNIGKFDRMVRLIIGVGAIYLGVAVSFWFYFLAAFAFYEAFSSWCAFYQIIGKNTCKIR
jgi:hypothetical protein